LIIAVEGISTSFTALCQFRNFIKNKKKEFMQYVLERISTVSGCDTLLLSAQQKKQTLERRRRNLGESLDTFRKRLDQLNLESAQVQLSFKAFTAAYEILPEGKNKADVNIRMKRLELRQAMLEKKALTYNVAALLVKELQYNRLASQVVVLEDYIKEIEHRMVALEALTLRIVQPTVLLRQPMARVGLTQRVLRLPAIRGSQEDYFRPQVHQLGYDAGFGAFTRASSALKD
jgi:hypothetical protein